ncbi:MAG: peptidoglycan DD-metalloendopeptidase family protein [Pseudomonadota bacterium]
MPEIHFDSNTYVVQPGDTLQSVADRYNLDPQTLGAANSLNASELVPGQKLLLVRSDRVAANSALADQPVAMIPSNREDPQFTAVNDASGVPVGPVVVVPPNEQIIAVKEPAGTDALLDEQPLIASLPDAPGAIPALRNAEVINDNVVAGATDRPQGTETIIQSVEASNPNVVEIPAATAAQPSNPVVPMPVKTVTVNTRANGWNWPALGTITRDFDLSEINRQGLDIDAGPGAGVQAAADGEVVYSGRDLASYGNLVILRHKDNYLSAYSKVSDIFVKENQKVKAGDLIAVVGDAVAEGTELHFEIRRNGEPVDPVEYLPAL